MVARARDHLLLDAIDALDRVPFRQTVWRVARDGRDPTQGHPSGGRWDPGTFDVLSTSCEADGAIAEVFFHLSRQPVFPSKPVWSLHALDASAERTLQLLDMVALKSLGVEEARYRDVLYARTREIGDAACFLGFDGLIAPSARWTGLNATFFTDRLDADALSLTDSSVIDWAAWSSRNRR